MKPLIAIDLNSTIDDDVLKSFLVKMFEKFGALDVVFIMDDESLVEVEHKIVHTFYNVTDVIENVKFLRKLSDKKKLSLHVNSLVSLNQELKKFPLIVVTNRPLKPKLDQLMFIFDGNSIKSSNKKFILSENRDAEPE
ncbi:hypothetical protein [Sulfuracidifex tepidarius]|uniref:Uncharacterized protein n=1 Tax=Sulfuracidifex tepidarius TaxID=1294262 RepID=A0A510E6V0_9CREN|nr:hypothetical protein [Sulfuracidifex tepidarius]BBG25477.1 hypothetical protein IC006_2813 [Sulfuracidifex tepidarius]BBG28271.1 hypothetical protein IC007_2827 [Sulfuracidifex tepidarius]